MIKNLTITALLLLATSSLFAGGLLTNTNHLDNHFWEYLGLFKRTCNVFTFRDLRADEHDAFLDNLVSSGVRHDFKTIENGNTGRYQRPKRPGKPSDGRFSDQGPKYRQFQQH